MENIYIYLVFKSTRPDKINRKVTIKKEDKNTMLSSGITDAREMIKVIFRNVQLLKFIELLNIKLAFFES